MAFLLAVVGPYIAGLGIHFGTKRWSSAVHRQVEVAGMTGFFVLLPTLLILTWLRDSFDSQAQMEQSMIGVLAGVAFCIGLTGKKPDRPLSDS